MSARPWLFALCAIFLTGCSQDGGQQASDKQSDVSVTQSAARDVPIGTGFDFYVLSLSWSPSYCEAEGDDANYQQCSAGRPYAFVVHGLWPQFERGFPENCSTQRRDLPEKILRSLYDIMPSAGLIRHQWRKHGSCSGLSQEDYFSVVRAARDGIAIPARFRHPKGYQNIDPDDVEDAFLKANPALSANAVAVTCDRRFLREVRICMTKDLEFRPCPEIDRRGCKRSSVTMPPVRGG